MRDAVNHQRRARREQVAKGLCLGDGGERRLGVFGHHGEQRERGALHRRPGRAGASRVGLARIDRPLVGARGQRACERGEARERPQCRGAKVKLAGEREHVDLRGGGVSPQEQAVIDEVGITCFEQRKGGCRLPGAGAADDEDARARAVHDGRGVEVKQALSSQRQRQGDLEHHRGGSGDGLALRSNAGWPRSVSRRAGRGHARRGPRAGSRPPPRTPGRSRERTRGRSLLRRGSNSAPGKAGRSVNWIAAGPGAGGGARKSRSAASGSRASPSQDQPSVVP